MNYGMNPYIQGNFQPNYMNPQPVQQNLEPPKKERLRLKMSSEERGFYSNLLQLADKDGHGKVIGKDAAEFLKRSGLPKETLKEIWIISAQTDPQFLERDEFYIALRLIALAQNNMEYSEDSIRLNHPIPPLPKFDLKTNVNSSTTSTSISNDNVVTTSQSNDIEAIFTMTEKEAEKYAMLFNKNKEYEKIISLGKAYQIWKSAQIPNEVFRQIFTIVKPLKDTKSLTLKEFQVVTHFIYKSIKNPIPQVLPNALKNFLFEESEKEKEEEQKPIGDIDFGKKLGMNLSFGVNTQTSPNPPVVSDISQGSINTNKSIEIDSALYSKPVKDASPVESFCFTEQKPVPVSQATKLEKDKDHITFSTDKLLEDEDISQVHSILEEIDKMCRSIGYYSEQNRQLKENIIETRKKINIEKENFAKAVISYGKKINELIENQEELTKTVENYNQFLKENNKPVYTSSSSTVDYGIKNEKEKKVNKDIPNQANFRSGNLMGNTNTNTNAQTAFGFDMKPQPQNETTAKLKSNNNLGNYSGLVQPGVPVESDAFNFGAAQFSGFNEGMDDNLNKQNNFEHNWDFQ